MKLEKLREAICGDLSSFHKSTFFCLFVLWFRPVLFCYLTSLYLKCVASNWVLFFIHSDNLCLAYKQLIKLLIWLDLGLPFVVLVFLCSFFLFFGSFDLFFKNVFIIIYCKFSYICLFIFFSGYLEITVCLSNFS